MPRNRLVTSARRVIQILLMALGCLLAASAVSAAQSPTVLVMRIDDTITPVVADHLEEGLRTAERDGHEAVLVEMDTPGGLLQSTREIVQDVLASDVPIIVYVTPSGARAASAGAYITLSAHVAAMAPGTHIGAGTPVTGQGEETSEKVVNDAVAFAVSIAEQRGRSTDFARDMVRDGKAVPDREAVRLDVVDRVAPSRGVLLTELDGRRVVVGSEDTEREVVLRTAGAQVVEHELGFFGELRQLLASPELAFLFLSIGTLAVIYELANPGMGFAGVIGVILLVLGFVALSVLPFNVGGLLLLALAAALFVAEVLTPGVGVFAAGGTAALVFAGVLMFRGELGVDPAVLWPTALVVGGGSVLAGRLAWRARKAPPTTGHQALLGREAVVRRAEGGAGQVLLEGAWWTVRGRDGALTEGQHVRVVDHEGLELIVESVDPAQGQGTEQEDRP
ncbi:NfeD family protein [Streptomyces sp. HC307]|uniref:NfeD family protein n=1 Tax=Streptomyces flavusporus TaxID=3385496 RepID=UPI003916D34E